MANTNTKGNYSEVLHLLTEEKKGWLLLISSTSDQRSNI